MLPLQNFGDDFYTHQILLDLKVENGMAIRTEPHPRFSNPQKTGPKGSCFRRLWPTAFNNRDDRSCGDGGDDDDDGAGIAVAPR